MLRLKQLIFDNYLINYFEVPVGTGKIIPLVVIESLALCVSYFISIYLINSLHFTAFEVGKLIAALSLGTGFGSLLSGYLTSKISATKVSALGLFIYSIGYFLLSTVTLYTPLLIILFFCGVGGVFMMIANLTALIQLAANDAMKNRIIVLQSVIFNISASIGGFLMSYLPTIAIQELFIGLGLLLLLAGCYVVRLKEFGSESIASVVAKGKLTINRPLLSMILPAIFFYGILYALVRLCLSIEVVSRFENPFFLWIVLSINPLFIIFFQPLLFAHLKNINNIKLLVVGALSLGIGYVLFGCSSNFLPSLLFLMLATLGEMLFSPISKKLASISFGPGHEGAGLAAWKTTYCLSSVVGAALVGFITENYHDFNGWFICFPLAMAIILCAGCYQLVVFNKRRNYVNITTTND